MKHLGIIKRPVVVCPITMEYRHIQSCADCDCYDGVDLQDDIVRCKADEEPYTAQLNEIKRLIKED